MRKYEMNILIKTVGFIGDNLFATSVAKKIKEKYGKDCIVDFQISILSPFELIFNNPYIDNVFISGELIGNYDKIYELKPIHRKETPTIQFQKMCEIENVSSEYEVYTNRALDLLIEKGFSEYKAGGYKTIAVQQNWEEKSFLFTEEEYIRGIDVPNLGYGGKRRNISFIIDSLNKIDNVVIIPVGKPNGYNQMSSDINTVSELTFTASVIKNCDYFIGSEGGLSNIAAGVGTRTIITGDFVHQLYGWNGVIEKNQDPKLGPKYYFNDVAHVTLNPYITDKSVVSQIQEIIKD
jgi:hypothetical protein